MRRLSGLDVTAPYTRIEGWVYDRFIAPGVVEAVGPLREELASLLPEGAELLDVGCGGGHMAVAIAELRPDVTVTGVDFSPEQVARARARAVAAGSGNCRFEEGDAASLPFPDDSFDAVISVGSVKHWQRLHRGLAETVRVLRPGGSLQLLELDPRYARNRERIRSMVRGTRLPRFARPGAVRFFHRYIGDSVDAEVVAGHLRDQPSCGEVTVLLDGGGAIPSYVVATRKQPAGVVAADRRA